MSYLLYNPPFTRNAPFITVQVMADEDAHGCVQGDLLGGFTQSTGFLLTTKPRVGFSGRPKRKASGHGVTRDFNTGINVPHEVFASAGKPLMVAVDGWEFVVHIMSAPHKQVNVEKTGGLCCLDGGSGSKHG